MNPNYNEKQSSDSVKDIATIHINEPKPKKKKIYDVKIGEWFKYSGDLHVKTGHECFFNLSNCTTYHSNCFPSEAEVTPCTNVKITCDIK